MTAISIIGTGNMGSAIAGIAAKAGAEVQVLARDIDKAQELAAQTGATAATVGDALTGELVVLAVPFAAVDEIIAAYGAQLDGRTVVDVTNPVDFATFDGLVVPADSSAAAVIASKTPAAMVVKAFNTTFGATLAAGVVGEATTTTVLVAGDDDDAKGTVIELIRAGGLDAVDAGTLKRARELEALGFLQITLAAREQIGWAGGFALVK
ncbi:NADPH-dependent F420 reductase [Salinibacterium sp. ZJ70]|uniref:NADPH-dependent F420 reductase n=1 Tax=Salinibacterium sp. ZJ70 TaxID=2708084 RepID=UPI00141F647D|nr:NADPH-dependent F420 reductase [Salinibacterium sp. ZJ70]